MLYATTSIAKTFIPAMLMTLKTTSALIIYGAMVITIVNAERLESGHLKNDVHGWLLLLFDLAPPRAISQLIFPCPKNISII